MSYVEKDCKQLLLVHRRSFLAFTTVSGLAGISAVRTFAREADAAWRERDVPYVHQAGGGDCYQACLAMVLRYFFPKEAFPLAELNRLTHHRPGYWTMEAQLLPALLDRKLQVELHASTPYAELTPALAEKRYGKLGAQKLDFQALAWSRPFLKPGVFFQHEMEWKELPARFDQGWAVIFCVNEDVLVKQNLGVFIGHGLVLVGVAETQARVHDPARRERMAYPLDRLAAAFASPGTDHACLLVKR